MAGELQPLDEKFPIVDQFGKPTLYFIKWAQQRQIDITDGITLQDLIDYLTAHMLQEGSGIQITPDGAIPNMPTIAADVQEILDQISTTRGAVIYRGLLGWAALAPGTAGDFLKTNGAGADPAWAPAAGGGAVSLISEVITSGSAANVTFSSISASYRDLEIRVRGRGTDAGADQPVRIRFNGDTGANYDYQQLFAQGGTTTAQGALTTSILVGQIPCAGSTANFSGLAILNVGDYRGTTFYKNLVCISGENRTGTAQRGMLTSGQWRNTAAITSVEVAMGAGNFVNGTVVSLYGHA